MVWFLDALTRARRGRWQASAPSYDHRRGVLLQQIALVVVLVLLTGGVDATRESDKQIRITRNSFAARGYISYFYLDSDRPSGWVGETFVMQDFLLKVWISHDHGKTWKMPPVLEDEQILAAYPNEYFNDVIFFPTPTSRVYYSPDRGLSFKLFYAPGPPAQLINRFLSFHPNHRDWFIWIAEAGCHSRSFSCKADAYLTQNGGLSWRLLRRHVRRCQFVDEEARGKRENLIYCEEYSSEDRGPDNSPRLVVSDDFFEDNISTPFSDIIVAMSASEFTVVGVKGTGHESLKIGASVDGMTFVEAPLPTNFRTPYANWFTLLDSSSHSGFLHVAENGFTASKYGSIFKSNSNGTSYVLSIRNVNRDGWGFIDFERMEGLNGVAIANIVANTEEVIEWIPKKLKTMITYNDGSKWGYIPAPLWDAQGKRVSCDVRNREKCSLHLRGQTELNAIAFSPSAAGLMVAVGNVGEYLGKPGDSDTYITRDGGVTWSASLKGSHVWEYGDQGSVIVLVKDDTPTNAFHFTLDAGITWTQHQFTDSMVQIIDISSSLNDDTLEFLLWTKESGPEGSLVTFNLDFTELRGKRKCVLSENGGDYFLWEPSSPTRYDNCQLGHVAQYARKKPDADCYVGATFRSLYAIKSNCSCTRDDYECNFGFERQPDELCSPIPGFQPGPGDQCRDPSAIEWFEPTPYRRIPLSTCMGGMELDKSFAHPCPALEVDEPYMKPWEVSGIKLIVAVSLAIMASAVVSWFIYRCSKEKLGRIRLEDSTRADLLSRKEGGYGGDMEESDPEE